MLRPAKRIERCGAVRRDDFTGIVIPLVSDSCERIEQSPVEQQRALGIGRNDLHGHTASFHPTSRLGVGQTVGPCGMPDTAVVPDDAFDTVGQFGMHPQQIVPVRQSAERHDDDTFGFVRERLPQQLDRRRKGIWNSRAVAPIDRRRMGPPIRYLPASRTSDTDRNPVVIESARQSSDPSGRLGRRQGPVGRNDGKYLNLPIPQQQAKRPQIVRRTVGVDDDMEPRLSGVSRHRQCIQCQQ